MLVKVKVKPEAKKEMFTVLKKDSFSISVREKAERGEANSRVRTLLARHFRVLPGVVNIVSGHRSPHKIISIKE